MGELKVSGRDLDFGAENERRENGTPIYFEKYINKHACNGG
ncbi:MAG TPA: hypothetical protein VI387_04275 [Candidatus Brocadiales bacterium]|nr:hypothetical protein [Candidatus Brocadiales bacterium]